MKTIYAFTGSNCTSCDALKPLLKERKDLNIKYFHLDEDLAFFNEMWVRWIPTVFEVERNIEVTGTRQTGNIDLTKY